MENEVEAWEGDLVIQILAWVAIAAAWISALFVNDQTPVMLAVHVILIITALALAIWRFTKVRDWPLLIVVLITPAAWFILLPIAMAISWA